VSTLFSKGCDLLYKYQGIYMLARYMPWPYVSVSLSVCHKPVFCENS